VIPKEQEDLENRMVPLEVVLGHQRVVLKLEGDLEYRRVSEEDSEHLRVVLKLEEDSEHQRVVPELGEDLGHRRVPEEVLGHPRVVLKLQ